jgi:hypothetical protein
MTSFHQFIILILRSFLPLTIPRLPFPALLFTVSFSLRKEIPEGSSEPDRTESSQRRLQGAMIDPQQDSLERTILKATALNEVNPQAPEDPDSDQRRSASLESRSALHSDSARI